MVVICRQVASLAPGTARVCGPDWLVARDRYIFMYLRNILPSRLFWVICVFGATLFGPWRVIYKGTHVFVRLPLWWEYSNPKENYLVILGHVGISLAIGMAIAWLVRKIMRKGSI